MKKLFALILTLALAVILIPWLNPAQSAEVTAVTDSNTFTSGAYTWAQDEITTAVEAELIKGYPDGTFQPANTITRAEFATVIARALDLKAGKTNLFSDVPADAWYTGYVTALTDAKVIRGSDYGTNMEPDEPITRKEIAVWTARASDMQGVEAGPATVNFSDYDNSDYYYNQVEKAVSLGILKGYPDGTFGPYKTADRAEAVVMLVRMLKLFPIYSGFDVRDPASLVNKYVENKDSKLVTSGFKDNGIEGTQYYKQMTKSFGPIVELEFQSLEKALLVKQDGTWKIARLWDTMPGGSAGNGKDEDNEPGNGNKPQVVRELEEITGGTAEKGSKYWVLEKPNGTAIQISYELDNTYYYDVNLVLYRGIAPYDLDLVKEIMLYLGGTEGAFNQVYDMVYNGLYVGKPIPWFITSDGVFKTAVIDNAISIRRLR